MSNDFLVLGDLTERELGEYTSPARRLIVRMFIGAETFDEEMDVDSVEELPGTVTARMTELEKKPDSELLVEANRPLHHPGHAIEVPAIEEQS